MRVRANGDKGIRMKPLTHITILEDKQAFRDLEEEWEELYHDSPLSTPFQSWSWLYSWWEAFGEGYELRLITVRNGGLLVGLIPLMLERWWGFRRLLFVGKFDQLDLLARDGWEDRVSEAGVRALRQMTGSWHVLDVQALSPTAAAWGIVRLWNGPCTCMPVDPYLFIEVKPSEKSLATLSRNQRQTVRRTLRRAEEDIVSSVLAGPETAEQAARRLVTLHRELRQGRRLIRDHLRPEFESFVVAAARRMTDRGLGGISELRRDGEVLISSFTIFGDSVTDAYLVGVRQEARQRYQWSSLGIWDALDLARSRDSAYLCLSNGRDPYKLRWAPKVVPYFRAILGRGRVLWALYSAAVALRTKGAPYVRVGSNYEPMRTAAEWLRRR